jgi:AraC-like DNA-binding protein
MTATVRVAGLRGFEQLVRSLHGNPGKLARDCGIDLDTLSNEDALIPYRQLIQLTEHCATVLHSPDFGLRLAAFQDIGVLGPLAVAMQNSSTVEEALRCAASHLFVQSPALALVIDEQGDETRLRIHIRLNNMPHRGMRQAEDLAIGVSHRTMAMLAGSEYKLLRVELPHEPLCPASVYQTYFNAQVSFSCPANAVYVATSTLQTSMPARSEQLHKLATRYLGMQYPADDDLVVSRVETAIRNTLGTDSCNRNAVSRAMAMHPRTLQRRLEKAGVTFDEIRDRIRRERADYYLRNTAAPLSQVAGIIGYSEQSILTRSCQRWFGQSPRKYRASQSP